MVFSAVFTANLFNGLNTTAWTAWVFFAVFIGGALLWVYTVRNLIDSVVTPLRRITTGGVQCHFTRVVRYLSLG